MTQINTIFKANQPLLLYIESHNHSGSHHNFFGTICKRRVCQCKTLQLGESILSKVEHIGYTMGTYALSDINV